MSGKMEGDEKVGEPKVCPHVIPVLLPCPLRKTCGEIRVFCNDALGIKAEAEEPEQMVYERHGGTPVRGGGVLLLFFI
jgi:hypothetical protein